MIPPIKQANKSSKQAYETAKRIAAQQRLKQQHEHKQQQQPIVSSLNISKSRLVHKNKVVFILFLKKTFIIFCSEWI